jgi:hypothetical protein
MQRWPLDLPLLQLTPADVWTLQRAVSGVIILGATRSGKTSGPFQYVIRSFLRAGFGGVFFCVKPDSMKDYKDILIAEGMLDEKESNDGSDPKTTKNIVLFGPDHQHEFNFLDYEMKQYGQGKAIIENIVEIFVQSSEILSRKYGHGKRDDFFENAMRQLLRNCLEVIIAAEGDIQLEVILKLVQSLPVTPEQVEERFEKNEALKLLRKAEELATQKKRHEQKAGLKLARGYFTKEWPQLAERTRSSIAITLSVLIDAFLRYPLRKLFCSGKTVDPDSIIKGGKILIVDVPVNRYYEFGKIAAVLWKTAMQRAILSRPELHPENLEGEKRSQPDDIDMRPIFLAGDEAQYFVSAGDTLFATTSASARGITVYSTQSLALLYSEMGSDANARSSVLALLGNLRNRFICNVDDPETTSWFANTLGKVIVKRRTAGESSNTSFSQSGIQFNTGGNESDAEQLDYDLQPRELAVLNQGGRGHKDPSRDCKVEAIITTAGWPFEANQKLWYKATFDQNLPSEQKPKDKSRVGLFSSLRLAISPQLAADEVRIIAERQR